MQVEVPERVCSEGLGATDLGSWINIGLEGANTGLGPSAMGKWSVNGCTKSLMVKSNLGSYPPMTHSPRPQDFPVSHPLACFPLSENLSFTSVSVPSLVIVTRSSHEAVQGLLPPTDVSHPHASQ